MPQEPPRAAALSSEEPHTLPVDHTTVLFHPWIPATYQMPSAFLTGPAGDVFGIDLSEVHSRLDQTTTVYNPRQAPTDPAGLSGQSYTCIRTLYFVFNKKLLILLERIVRLPMPRPSLAGVQSAAQTIAKPHSVSIPLGLISISDPLGILALVRARSGKREETRSAPSRNRRLPWT
jgi:hypothetical protein